LISIAVVEPPHAIVRGIIIHATMTPGESNIMKAVNRFVIRNIASTNRKINTPINTPVVRGNPNNFDMFVDLLISLFSNGSFMFIY